MLRRATHTLAISCAAALALTGCSRDDSAPAQGTPSSSSDSPPRPSSSAARPPAPPDSPLAALIRRCAAEEPDPSADCGSGLQRLAKQEALLEVGGIRHKATHVYFCEELTRRGRERDPWRCESELTHADDTLHTTEHDHPLVALGAGERIRLVTEAGHPPAGLIKVGVGGALDLHADGYVAARRLTVDRGASLTATEIPAGRRTLLFALFRHDDRWVRKHVWVVRQPAADAGR